MDEFDLLVCADRLRDYLCSQGLTDARVAGWLASGGTLPLGVAAEIYISVPSPDWTPGDLARIGRQATCLIGWPILLWAVPPGEEELLPGETVAWL